MPASAQRPPPTHPVVDDGVATAEAIVADPTGAGGPLCIYLDNHAPDDVDTTACPLIQDQDGDDVPDGVDETLCALDPERGVSTCGLEESEVAPGEALPFLYGRAVLVA